MICKKYLLLMLMSLYLVGCSTSAKYYSAQQRMLLLTNQMSHYHVKTIILGDQIKIVIPSSRLFINMTDSFSMVAEKMLTKVLSCMRNYSIMSIKVAAYTDDTGPKVVLQELSTMQAQKVARYLYDSGIRARIFTAEGYGSTNLIAPVLSKDEPGNYRVEIVIKILALTADD